MPAKWIPKAIATSFGYVHARTGELLASRRNLTPDGGTTGYKRNSKAWATAYAVNRPRATVAPAITGTATVGQTLTTTNGTWVGTPTPTFTRQWTRNGYPIASATALTYVLVAADAGQRIRVEVTGTSTAGKSVSTSNTVAVA